MMMEKAYGLSVVNFIHILRAAFLYLQFGFVTFRRKNMSAKAAP